MTKLDSCEDYFEYLFDTAPVMMHSLESEGRIVAVNDLWLQKLGYEREEVLGKKPIDFLSEASRLRATRDTLPLFWRVGSARSIGCEFVRKDGRVVDVLLDADLVDDCGGRMRARATLRDAKDESAWEQASTILKLLRLVSLLESADGDLPERDDGQMSLTPPITQHLGPLGDLLEPEGPKLVAPTRRELEVLQRVALGARNKEIAEQRGLSVRTVRFHLENLFEQLDVQTRTEAVMVAGERGHLN